jgi:hypothetical protein
MKKIWKFIRANIETIGAIGVSLVATAFGVFQVDQLYLLAGVSLALGLVSVGLIRDRHNRELLADQVAELKKCLPEHPSSEAFFRKTPDLGPLIKAADQVDLCGVTLTTTINRHSAMLRTHLENGGKLRILLIDPKSKAIEMSAQRSLSVKDTEYYRERLKTTLRDIAYLIKYTQAANLSKPKNGKASGVEVRLLSYAPSFGISSFDTRKRKGILFIEMYSHKYGFNLSPTFQLTPGNDGKWYRYFAGQFEEMWKAASVWDPTPSLKKISAEK